MSESHKGSPAMRALSLKIAEDLCLRLLERRTTNPSKVPGLISLIGGRCLAMLEGEGDTGLPLLRMSASLTGRLIERGSLSDPEAICRHLSEFLGTLREIAAGLPKGHERDILATAVTLTLKMLETKFLSQANVQKTLREITDKAKELFR